MKTRKLGNSPLHLTPVGLGTWAIGGGDWKAVRNGPQAKVEIYDLKADSAERHDLAATRPELVEKALAIFKQAHVDDPNWPMRDLKAANAAKKASR